MPPSEVAAPETVRGLQERAARALPAREAVDVAGWVLRDAPGCAWWVGTAQPHGDTDGPGELARRLAEAEKFYAARGTAAGFQISPGACPQALDGVLAQRGYRRHGSLSLQAAPTDRVVSAGSAAPLRVHVDDRPSRAWFDTWLAVQGPTADQRAERELLDRVPGPSAYACAVLGDDVVAVGRAVADTGWAGVFGMSALPRARGLGAGRAVLAALADWARTQAAERMYLQVLRDNTPALRLYERSGFSEVCHYHYRRAD
ncbi:GNAT family N-acetyltransferase [Streptomonospora litoralis]|uniref:Mycothiol acetyltransferase n=1 Tax=Streptomonospora litoralis TaxID=2498135 RepID=A0A4P6PYQ3_9ACTN|nr:GNAT family N-acetyltransferase [Streptomonospora litoralis]QBI53295.1 Mycothiol acetyltransferase [Streptomonospora litoralis]